MLGRLTPVGGGIPIILLNKTVTLGRDPANDHVLSCGSVSGKHCELELVDGYWWVRDVGSRNGTSVNNVRCQTSIILPGGLLRIANQRLRLDYKEPRLSSDEEVAMNLLMEVIPDAPPSPVPIEKPAPSKASVANPPAVRQRSDSSHTTFPVMASTKLVRRFLGKLLPCG